MQGIVILAVYFVIMMAITVIFSSKNITKDEFLVANRRMGTWQSALSIAATWIWAPALFISAEKSYINGIPGLFWFLVPNLLCLLIFIPFAIKIREQMPDGFTLSGYMKRKYSDRVKNIYVFQLSFLALLSTVVQLLAGGMILSTIMDVPFWPMTILLGMIAYSYSRISGIKASIITDSFQMIFILVACALFVPWAIRVNNFEAIKSGLGGISGNFKSLFDTNGKEVFLSFGLATTIGLIAGPFGDQCFWQRVFALDKRKIKKSFILGAIAFGIVPLSMGILGFIAAGTGFIANKTSIVNLELISAILPSWVVLPFIFMLISGLLSTIDSNLCAISSLTVDIYSKHDIKLARKSMITLIGLAILISNVPGLSITHLFLIYGTLRASTLFTTILTLKGIRLSEEGVFYGVLLAMLIGLPIFAAGVLLKINLIKVIGSLSTVVLSGAIALIHTKVRGVKYDIR